MLCCILPTLEYANFGIYASDAPSPIALRNVQAWDYGVNADGIRAGSGLCCRRTSPPWGESNSAQYRTADVKVSNRGGEPRYISMSERAAALQSMRFASIHGGAHLKDRNSTVLRLVNLNVDHVAAFSVEFKVDTWGLAVSDCDGSFGDGFRRLLRMAPQGCKRGQAARISLPTNWGASPVWNFPRTLTWIAPAAFGKEGSDVNWGVWRVDSCRMR